MFFIQIINLLIRFTLILSETYIKNESVFYLPDYFGKIDRYFVYPAMREINTEHGKFNLTFKRRDCLVNSFDYIVYNISNKITNASFEGIDPKEILKRDKPNEEIVFYQMIPFIKFTKNLGYIKKAVLGIEYLHGATRMYLPFEEYFFDQYLGGLPESIKKKYNYKTSFKIKEIISIFGILDEGYKYILEDKILNIRYNFDNSTSIYLNEEFEKISMCFDLKFLFKEYRSDYFSSVVDKYLRRNYYYIDDDNILHYNITDPVYFPNFTLFFDGKEITFPKNILLDSINPPGYNCSFGFYFFWMFNATEIDYDNNIITFYSDKEIFKHFDNGNNKKKIKNNIFTNFTIVFIIFVVLILFFRNKIRKEKQENYEKYFNIEKL